MKREKLEEQQCHKYRLLKLKSWWQAESSHYSFNSHIYHPSSPKFKIPKLHNSKIQENTTITALICIKMAIQLENLMESIKSKVRSLKKSKKPYVKMDKSASVRVEIRSRKAKKLIDKTLKAADHPGKKPLH